MHIHVVRKRTSTLYDQSAVNIRYCHHSKIYKPDTCDWHNRLGFPYSCSQTSQGRIDTHTPCHGRHRWHYSCKGWIPLSRKKSFFRSIRPWSLAGKCTSRSWCHRRTQRCWSTCCRRSHRCSLRIVLLQTRWGSDTCEIYDLDERHFWFWDVDHIFLWL